jgi:hypothetical protein
MPAPRNFGIGILALALLSASCSSGSGILGSSEGLSHAVAAQSCGPADGPAVSIYLTPGEVSSLEPPAPYVRITVLQPLGRLTERSWTLNGNAADADGAAVYYAGTGSEIATSGEVRVSTVDADRTVHGFADLRFPTLGHVRGDFHAEWNPRVTVCG